MGNNIVFIVGVLCLLWVLYRLLYFTYPYVRKSGIKKYCQDNVFALVTGSTDGIGKAMAFELAKNGFNIILHGRNPIKLSVVKIELEKAYPLCKVVSLLHDGNQSSHLDLTTVDHLPIRILVNNVGTGPVSKLSDLTEEEIEACIRLNTEVPSKLTRSLLPRLREQPSLILNVSSYAGLYPPPFLAVYAGTKAYNNTFSISLAREYEDIEVISLITGSVNTGSNLKPITFMRPAAATYAKSIISIIGSGRKSIYPYWPHAIQAFLISLIPEPMADNAIKNAMLKEMRISIKKLSLALIFMMTGLAVPAQDRIDNRISIAPELGSFKADYIYSHFKVGGENAQIQQTNANLVLPLYHKLKDKKLDFFLIGLGYTGVFLSGSTSEYGTTAFHSFSLPLTFQKSISSKYAMMISFIPTLSSELKDISGEDIIYTGVAMFKVKVSNRFAYSLGALYSRQFYGGLLLPLIGVDWEINDRISFTGSLPISQKLKYNLTKKNAIGIHNNLGIGGGAYRLSAQMSSAYFQTQQSKLSLFYTFVPVKSFAIEVNAGYNYLQKLGLYDKNEKIKLAPFDRLEDRTPLSEVKNTGFAVGLGIHHRF